MTIGSAGIGIGIIYTKLVGGLARAIGGFTGLINCGNLLTEKLDVGNNGNTVYGASIGQGYGNLNGATIAGLPIYRIAVDSVLQVPVLAMGDGTQQIPGVIDITLNFQSYGIITLDWDGTNLIYTKNGGAESAAFSAYIISLFGQRTSYDLQNSLANAYDATQANFGGLTNLSRVLAASAETNESTISMFVRFNTSGIAQKVYDIGDAADGTGAETTRMRINASDIMRAIFSNWDGAGWSQIASVDSRRYYHR